MCAQDVKTLTDTALTTFSGRLFQALTTHMEKNLCIRVVKVKVVLYSAVYSPSDRSKRFTLFALPGRPVHSDTNSASPGSILAMQQLRATTKSLTCPPLSMARYSFIQLSQQGCQWRERKCPIFETVAKGDSNPGSLDCESGILPLSYRAPQWWHIHFSSAYIVEPGAKTINVFRACLGAQLTICAQK